MGVEVSPLHARRFKSGAASAPFHVSAMFSDAHPRGVKRKARSLDDHSDELEDDEEEEDDVEAETSSSSSCSSASSTAGSTSGDDARSYSRRRHVVFNMSLCKLTRFRQAADPSLLRSVLVCNTLRALERDLGPPRCPDPPPAPLGHYASQCHHLHHLHHGYATEDCYDRCPGVGGVMGGDSGGRLTPFVRPEAMTPLWTDEDRLPSLNWSSVLNFGTAPVAPPQPSSPEGSSTTSSSTGEHGGPAPLYTLLPAHNGTGVVSSASGATCTTSSSSAGSSSSSSDEIFGDIDLSLYDFDLLSPLSPPNVKVAPVSADDLMRSLAASSQTDCVVTTSASAATCQLVASSGQQVNFCYKPIGEDHVATVMS